MKKVEFQHRGVKMTIDQEVIDEQKKMGIDAVAEMKKAIDEQLDNGEIVESVEKKTLLG